MGNKAREINSPVIKQLLDETNPEELNIIDAGMENNKTAVEWLQSIELERDLTLADWKQAKEMHKEQIRKAYCDGEYYKDTKLSTDYYNETYK
jgi:hypothetical protein